MRLSTQMIKQDSSSNSIWQVANPRFMLLNGLFLTMLLLLVACGGGRGNNGGSFPGTSTGSGNVPGVGGGGSPADKASQQACFAATLYPLLTVKQSGAVNGTRSCADCHSGNPLTAGAPLFASDNLATALDAIYPSRVNFINPASSAILIKVRDKQHRFGYLAGTVDAAATLLTDQINAWADQCNNRGTQPTGNGIFSSITNIATAQANGNGGSARFNDKTIALYYFNDEGGSDGLTVTDSSVQGTPLNLTLSATADFNWPSGGGLTNINGKVTANAANSKKLYDWIAGAFGTKQYSLEAWIIPDATMTAPGTPYRIMTYSNPTSDSQNRNFTMGQIGQGTGGYLSFRHRSSVGRHNGDVGDPQSAAGTLLPQLTHVVMTFSEAAGRKVYIDGVQKSADAQAQTITNNATATDNWDASFNFGLLNEVTSNNRIWKGTMMLAAVHSVALTEEQIQQNFTAGVSGNSLTLRFDVSQHTGINNNFVTMDVAEYGGNAYLFSNPTFEVSGAVSTIPQTANGDYLYATYCAGCHNAAPGEKANRTAAQIDASIKANSGNMNVVEVNDNGTLKKLSDLTPAQLDLIANRISAAYVPPIDGLALYKTNCEGCHGIAPGAKADRTAAQISASIVNTAAMQTAGLQALNAAQLSAIETAIKTPTVVAVNYNVPIKNIRIGVGATTAVVGQTFKNVDVTATSNKQSLSALGAVIAQNAGSATDSFFLEFEVLGSKSNVVVEAPPATPPMDSSVVLRVDSGIRNFDQVNDTMSVLTGVAKSQTSASYTAVKKQLPTSGDLMTFVAAQQVGIIKLALDYCSKMVDNNNTYFGTANPSDAQIRDLVVDKLLDNGLQNQPSRDAVRGDIYTLLVALSGCNGAGTEVSGGVVIGPLTCSDQRQAKITACIAGLSSAPMMVQ